MFDMLFWWKHVYNTLHNEGMVRNQSDWRGHRRTKSTENTDFFAITLKTEQDTK
jgi:hypothetical protein